MLMCTLTDSPVCCDVQMMYRGNSYYANEIKLKESMVFACKTVDGASCSKDLLLHKKLNYIYEAGWQLYG
jgi:hypothetical protein